MLRSEEYMKEVRRTSSQQRVLLVAEGVLAHVAVVPLVSTRTSHGPFPLQNPGNVTALGPQQFCSLERNTSMLRASSCALDSVGHGLSVFFLSS